jgi:hypothetical protein
MAEALRESAGDVRMQFNVWYGGQVIFPDVAVQGWSLQWDQTRQVMGQGTFAVLDPDALLLPWSYDDALSVGGGMIQSKLICGSSSLDLGFQRITRSTPAESWRLMESPLGGKTWVAGTHVIQINADDKTTMVATADFLAPETPPAGATVFSELRRITTGIIDVIIDNALTDRAVPATVVYKDKRMDTVQQLADAIDAGLRVTGGGQLSVYKRPTASTWTVAGGSHDASLIKAQRSAQYSGLYNAVISRNVLANGREIQGIAVQRGGPLDWDGPHGHVPLVHQASFATDQASIDQDAQTQLTTITRRRSSTVPFSTLLNPAIETGDMVTLMLPIFDGTEQPLPGTITTVTIAGNGGVNAQMDFTLDVADTDIAAIGQTNRARKWLA